jgi:hypothetical protein
MQRDTRRKIESCILQILEQREFHGLLQKQIAVRLRNSGFFPDEYELREILRDMWAAGQLLKHRIDSEWSRPVRYKLNLTSDSTIIPEIVVSPYQS